MIGYFVIIGLFTVIGMVVSRRLKGKFKKYSMVGLRSGMSGKEVAEAMLRHYNIHDVQIMEGKGFLSDHYNPLKKVVNLSPAVYNGRSVSAAAVAAHECGHAVQHNTSYAWLKFRSAIVPFVNFANTTQQYLFYAVLFGFAVAGSAMGNILIMVLIASLAITTAFAFITLPVEFDASNRALAWLDETGVAQGAEYTGAKDALWWAAMTYVAGALSSLAVLIYFALTFLGND